MTITTSPMLALVPGTRTAPGAGANTGSRAHRMKHDYRQSCSCPTCVFHFQLSGERAFAALHSAGYDAWLDHVWHAAACTRPVRLRGAIRHVDAATGELLRTIPTLGMPDGVIYKPCGNRRVTTCPGCAETYRRDAYHLIRAGLIGGKGIAADVATHPAVFATFTAPSFGLVHTRPIRQHTCTDKSRCRCRPQPCHARRDPGRCEHGRPDACFTRHAPDDLKLGQPLCPDCYDYPAHVVWNNSAGELWRRTKQAIERRLGQLAAIGASPRSGFPAVTARPAWLIRSASPMARPPNTRPAARSTSTPCSASTAMTPPTRTSCSPRPPSSPPPTWTRPPGGPPKPSPTAPRLTRPGPGAGPSAGALRSTSASSP